MAGLVMDASNTALYEYEKFRPPTSTLKYQSLSVGKSVGTNPPTLGALSFRHQASGFSRFRGRAARADMPACRPAAHPDSPVKTLSALAALLLSVFLLIAGNSLIGVLAPLRASLDEFPDFAIGLLGSVYFAGMLAGTLATPAIVRRAGHIRAFSAFVAVGIVSVILMPAWVAPAPWMAARGALGFVFAGIYAVVESWINAKASNANRGALYGVYQIVNFAASAGGQLLLRAFAPA